MNLYELFLNQNLFKSISNLVRKRTNFVKNMSESCSFFSFSRKFRRVFEFGTLFQSKDTIRYRVIPQYGFYNFLKRIEGLRFPLALKPYF